MTTIIGLDGETREWDAAFAKQAGAECAHGLATISGYIIRRWCGDAARQQDIAQLDGATKFAEAIEIKRAALADIAATSFAGYAMIDTLYECGCRGQA